MLTIAVIFTSVLSAMITFFISIRLEQGAVRASALPSLVLGLIFLTFKNHIDPDWYRQIPLAYYGATFIGMVSIQVLPRWRLIALSGLIFAFLFLHSSQFFKGFGGALGTAASISIVVTIAIDFIFPHFRLGKRK